MTTRTESAAPSLRKDVPLTELVQQIVEIIKQADDSVSPSQYSENHEKLRSIWRSILQTGLAPKAGPKSLSGVLQLLSVTLQKTPGYLCGDDNTFLLEIIDRILPVMLRPADGKWVPDLIKVLVRVLSLLSDTDDRQQLAATMQSFYALFQDAYSVAIALSFDASNAATIQWMNARCDSAAEGMRRPVELAVKDAASCEQLLALLLKVISRSLADQFPATSPPVAAIHSAACLMASSSVKLQSAAMQFVTAVLRVGPCVASALLRLPERLDLMLCSAPVVLFSSAGQLTLPPPAGVVDEWQKSLVLLLNGMVDALHEQPFGLCFGGLPGIARLAANAAVSAPANSNFQERLLRFVAELSIRDISVLNALACCIPSLSICTPVGRDSLLEAVHFALHRRLNQAEDERSVGVVASSLRLLLFSDEPGRARPHGLRNDQHPSSYRRRSNTKRQRIVDPETEDQSQRIEVDDVIPDVRETCIEEGGAEDDIEELCYAFCREISALQRRIVDCTDSAAAMHALACILQTLADIAPHEVAKLAGTALHSWPARNTLDSGAKDLDDDQLGAVLRLISVGLFATSLQEPQSRDVASLGLPPDLSTVILTSIRSERRSGIYAMPVALWACCLNVSNCGGSAILADVFDCARAIDPEVQRVRAVLLPTAALLAGIAATSTAQATSVPLETHRSLKARNQSQQPASNPIKPVVHRLASAASKEKETALALAVGAHVVIDWAHDAERAVECAIAAAQKGRFVALHEKQDQAAPTLPVATSDWLRPLLSSLTAAECASQPDIAAELISAVAGFIQRASPGHLEHSRDLARWLLKQAGSSEDAVRLAFFPYAPILSSVEFVLAAYAEESHPVPSQQRRLMADKLEHEVVKMFTDQVNSSQDCKFIEDVIHVATHAGSDMHSPGSQMLIMGILVKALDQKDAGITAMAAEAIKGMASYRGCSPADLFFCTSLISGVVAQKLPKSPMLLQEVADVVGMSHRAVAARMVPTALQTLLAKGDRPALHSLANAAGINTQTMMLQYGHHPLASCLMRTGMDLDSLMPIAEELSGQDFVNLANSILANTVTEVVSQAGAAHEWDRVGENAPNALILHTAKVLVLLAETVNALPKLPERDTSLPPSEGSHLRMKRVAEFLADGDLITRMLKDFGDTLHDKLNPASGAWTNLSPLDRTQALSKLRAVLVLVFLTGKYVGRFLPQFMVLLGAAVKPAVHKDVKMQALAGWRHLIDALAKHAAVALGGVVNQIVVTLLDPLQEKGSVGFAAARVVGDIITACSKLFPEKLRKMPPLPQWPEGLRDVKERLQEARGDFTTTEQVEVMLESLASEALAVRAVALQELRGLLASRRDWVSSLHPQDATPAHKALLQRLVTALLKCAEPEAPTSTAKAAQQSCAECLGILGAVDPSLMPLESPPHPGRARTLLDLAIQVVNPHLLRLLKTAPTMQSLDLTTLAIQDVLRCHARVSLAMEDQKTHGSARKTRNAASAAATGIETAAKGAKTGTPRAAAKSRGNTPNPESNALFAALPEEAQAIVRPYLDSKYSIKASAKLVEGIVFEPGIILRRWLANWLTQLIEKHCSGEQLALFKAVNPVARFDIPTAMFLAPYIVRNAVACGKPKAATDVAAELQAVLKASASTKEEAMCMQAVFTLLDVLHRWSEADKPAAKSSTTSTTSVSTSGETSNDATDAYAAAADENAKVQRLLASIPKDTLARAAAACGAHARALLHYETHLRADRKRCANPAAGDPTPNYEDDQVSFLLEVYARLEEPDGLDGLIKLRQTTRTADQRLAAEKSGSWAEALTLYERDLAHRRETALFGGGDRAVGGDTGAEDGTERARAGYLNCLLQMGHWQGLLTQVEGMASGLLSVSHGAREGERDRSRRRNYDTSCAQLAAMGTAAAWRLGRWEELQGYLQIVRQGFDSLGPEDRWEVRIGRLLRAAAADAGDETTRHALSQQINIDAKNATVVDQICTEARGALLEDCLAKELEGARAEAMGLFTAAAMESYTRAYPHLVRLHMLQEIADVASLMRGSGAPAGPNERRRALRWEERLALTQRSLATQAPILALRRQLAAISGASQDAGRCWLQHAQLCRDTGHFDAAVPAVLEAVTTGVPGAAMERVELLYARGEHHRAIAELQALETAMNHIGDNNNNNTANSSSVLAAYRTEGERSKYRAAVVLRLAELMAETGQGATETVTGMFEHALALRSGWDEALFQYAAYLDQLMQDAKARQEGSVSEPTSGKKATDRLGGKSRIRLGEDRPYLEFLPEVLKNYGRAVVAGHAHVYRSLPRLLTLWFEFGSAAAASPDDSVERRMSASVMEIMQKFSKTVPMHCWLTALPQLISRICHRHVEVAALTRQIVVQVTVNYHHQALWALAAVSKSTVQARRSAANGILAHAKRLVTDESVRPVFAEFNQICEQLIRVCHHQPSSNKTRLISAKREFPTLPRSFHNTSVMIPVMASLTPALPSPGTATSREAWRPFGNAVLIHALRDEIDVMVSLQKPKRIVIIGSDGREYPFLAKPKDDLRKDNRMMEAAGVLNRLFQEESASRRRALTIRRFAVVPITEEAGVVEWVGNTRPVRTCIVDIFSEFMDVKQDNHAIKNAYERTTAPKTRGSGAQASGITALMTWLEHVLKTHPPVFHRWFLGKFPEPAAWLNARLAYTRTYAVWCMVGHMVGLGDRHGENVLIDESCGDAIQIDFGCLFDKGLVLPQPEMVPFRLTQNMIDAFGVAGIEGLYRRTCEITLGVLRKHRDTIMPVMDTFLHDPLVDWVRDEDRRRKHGGDASGEGENPQARDALATIDGRLQGTILGVASKPCMAMSVEGHSASLIQEACSKENLAQMYIWWQAWY